MSKKIKRIVSTFLIALLLGGVSNTANAEDIPDIHGQYGVSIEANTGEVLYDKNAHEKAYPASITKIITGMLLLENVKDGEIIEVSDWASGQIASNYHFKLAPGEKIKKEDALFALMLVSANDVSMAIAEHVGETQEGFAKLMNEKAKEIGMEITNFVTPSGLHDPNHYTTAYDLALLGQKAMEYPELMEAMGTKKTTVSVEQTNGEMRQIEIENPSKIHDNPIALGGKTGYTNAAQNTLLEILEKDNKRVITVTLKTTLAEEYNDIDIMTQFALQQIQNKKVIEKGKIVEKKTVSGEEVNILASEDFYFSYKEQGEKELKEKVSIEIEEKSIKKGEVVGKVEYFYGEEKVKEVKLISDKTVESKGADENVLFWFGIFLPIPFYIIHTIYHSKRKNKNTAVK